MVGVNDLTGLNTCLPHGGSVYIYRIAKGSSRNTMQSVPAGYPIVELTGPYIVGALLNWGLFGTLSVQLYLYYLAFPNDRRFVKCLVYGIYIIEFGQTMLIAHDAFTMFGYGFGDMDTLTRINLFWLIGPIMSAVASGVGQVFYAYRIYILSKSRIILIFIICLSLTSSVVAMLLGIGYFKAGNITKLNNRKTHIAVGISCGAAALCDILIAVCMTYYLMRRTTNIRSTRILVSKIIRLTIETGSVTAVMALLSFVIFIAFPHRSFFVTTGSIVPKLYANTIYMVLNSRFQISGGRDTYMSSTDISITTMMMRDSISQSVEGTQPAEGMQGPAPVVTISNEIFNDNYEADQTSVSHGTSRAFLELILPQDKPQDGYTVLSP
ncbi:hypothetical protein IW261DRAFT_1591128 [Armillaria novae-zelandiae]|uniref:DUF6534 domain-containing protein n=1 Tax=Armillaria novae-zelandiae TaxID=153914 RepID=A0AA39PIA4_9AGAR|nr:hypothetical protein IW261DRAFT_1591128 [Armillaria novae-zelandiae]